jgi:transcriptional regulator with XRE-family HTH domain
MITIMATRIGKGRRPHLYINEHMAVKGMSNAGIANKLDIHRSTVGKWLAKGDNINLAELAQLAHALDLEDWRDFLRPPGQKSVDFLIEGASNEYREAVFDFVRKTGRARPRPKSYQRPLLAECGPICNRRQPSRCIPDSIDRTCQPGKTRGLELPWRTTPQEQAR